MPEANFEQNFGQLVVSGLAEKVPSLLPFRVGFQIIDVTEDEKHAVGFSAFVMNGIWLYVPSIFIKGRIRGHDLLYVKQMDMMIPNRENWIAYLRESGVRPFGKAVEPDAVSDLGFQGPDMSKIQDPMTDKLGAKLGTGSLIDLPTLRRMTVDVPELTAADLPDIVRDIPRMGKTAGWAFVNSLCAYPELADSIVTMHGDDAIYKLACAIDGMEEKMAAAENLDSQVEYFIHKYGQDEDSTDIFAGLTDTEKRLMVRNGIYVRDKRRFNISRVFNNDLESFTVQNPTENGTWEILQPDGTYKKAIILILGGDKHTEHPATSWDSSNLKTQRKVAVIPTDGIESGGCIFTTADKVYARKCSPVNMSEAKVTGLKASLERFPTKWSWGRILLLPSLKHPKVFETCGRTEDVDGNTRMKVRWDVGDRGCSRELPLVFTDNDAKEVQVTGGAVYVPADTLVFLDADRLKSLRKRDDASVPMPVTEGSPDFDTAEVMFGEPAIVRRRLIKDAGMVPLKIWMPGQDDIEITAGDSSDRMGYIDALKTLIEKHGIHAGQAQSMLKDAARSPQRIGRWFVKHAFSYVDEAPTSFPWANRGAATSPRSEESQTRGAAIPEMRTITPNDAGALMTASGAGIREVMDAGVLKSLANIADLSDTKEQFLSDMLRGVDRTGRMLFLFYWKNDEMEERYGEEDMRELENTLLDVFLSLGDLVLFLKEKTVLPTGEAGEVLLGELAEDVGNVDSAP